MDSQTTEQMSQHQPKQLKDLQDSLSKKRLQLETEIQQTQSQFLQQFLKLMNLIEKQQEYNKEIAIIKLQLQQSEEEEFNAKKSSIEDLEQVLRRLQSTTEKEISIHEAFEEDFEKFEGIINQTISTVKSKLDEYSTDFTTKMTNLKQEIKTRKRDCVKIKNSFDKRLEMFSQAFGQIQQALDLKSKIQINWKWEHDEYLNGKIKISDDGVTAENIESKNHHRMIFGDTLFEGDIDVHKWQMRYNWYNNWCFVGVCEESTKKTIISEYDKNQSITTYKKAYGKFLSNSSSHYLDTSKGCNVKSGETIDFEMNMDSGEFKITHNGQVIGTKNLKEQIQNGVKLVPFINTHYKGTKFDLTIL